MRKENGERVCPAKGERIGHVFGGEKWERSGRGPGEFPRTPNPVRRPWAGRRKRKRKQEPRGRPRTGAVGKGARKQKKIRWFEKRRMLDQICGPPGFASGSRHRLRRN